LGGLGAGVGAVVGRVPGAGVGFVLGTGLNMGLDFAHLHACDAKVAKMKADAKNAYDACLKSQGNQDAN
jgi:hypothetical protein